MERVEDFLQKFGLSELEQQIYLGLLETGPTTVLKLAKHTGIKRTTVHVNVESLIDKRFIAQTKSGSRRQIVAEDPQQLEQIVTKRKKELSEVESVLPSMIKTLTARKSKGTSSRKNDVEIRYYEGRSQVESVYEQILQADKVYSFADLNAYYEVFPGSEELWYNALKNNKNREVWDLLISSQKAQTLTHESPDRYYSKIIPSSSGMKYTFADYIVFDDNVAIVSLNPKDLNAIVIGSKEISHSLRLLHKSMWDAV